MKPNYEGVKSKHNFIGFAFANVEAAAEFEDQRSRFFGEHERYDDYMEMKEGLDLSYLPHFKEYMVS